MSYFFFSSRRRHTRLQGDWSSDVCSSDLGWEMPVQYAGIRAEHVAVRTSVGIFDVSHMGEIETSGPDAEAFLQRILSNDVSKLAPGGAQYSLLCRDDGGVLDDLFTYNFGSG